jgi:hypothetical protein
MFIFMHFFSTFKPGTVLVLKSLFIPTFHFLSLGINLGLKHMGVLFQILLAFPSTLWACAFP